ncbi:MAG: hypothetical protein HYU63_09100 [Armatimonadetes bacterium]|nr:hypothetical protein [Armatimonadota bacterium]
MIKLDYQNLKNFINNEELLNLKEKVKLAHHKLHNKNLSNNSPLGWLDLPFNFKEETMLQIEELAEEVIKNSEILIVIGIGGSYLGAKAALCALKPNFYNLSKDKFPKIFFAGINLSSDYLNDLLTIIQNKEIYLNVISKSGTTIEPALTFRILKDFLEKRYGEKEASRRIIATTKYLTISFKI